MPWERSFKMIGIYKITNKINGKIYIGQSNDIERRFKEHIHRSPRFRLSIDWSIVKYGEENFSFEILEECEKEKLNERETYYIQKYNSIEKGYNQNLGGDFGSRGSGNGMAKLSEEDVIKIRLAYARHERQKDVYELFKEKTTFSNFQGVWQGANWSEIMPEVFTEENKNYYIYQNSRKFTDEEVLIIRKRYVNETCDEIYKDYTGRVTKNSFRGILTGQTYKHLPIYKKKTKKWINDKPVSTISRTGE